MEQDSSNNYLDLLKEDFLTCAICFEDFDDENHQPRILPCQHCICIDCLRKIALSNRVTCPTCRQEFKTRNNNIYIFPKDNIRRELISFVKKRQTECAIKCEICKLKEYFASHCCKDCGIYLCVSCHLTHVTVDMFKNHKTAALNDNKNHRFTNDSEICSVKGHELEICKLYCKTCSMAICTFCVIDVHKGHTFENIKLVQNKRITVLSSKKDQLLLHKNSIENNISNLENQKAKSRKMGKKVKDKIQEKFKECHDLLKKQMEYSLSEVDKKLESFDSMMSNELRNQKLVHLGVLKLSKSLEHLVNLYKCKPTVVIPFSANFERQLLLSEFPHRDIPEQEEWILFSMEGLQEFTKSVKSLGNVVSTNAMAAYTDVVVPRQLFLNEPISVTVTLNDSKFQMVSDQSLVVSAILTNSDKTTDMPIENISRCRLEEDGRYRVTVTPVSMEQCYLHVLVHGLPFIQPINIDVIENKEPDCKLRKRNESSCTPLDQKAKSTKSGIDNEPSTSSTNAAIVSSVPCFLEDSSNHVMESSETPKGNFGFKKNIIQKYGAPLVPSAVDLNQTSKSRNMVHPGIKIQNGKVVSYEIPFADKTLMAMGVAPPVTKDTSSVIQDKSILKKNITSVSDDRVKHTLPASSRKRSASACLPNNQDGGKESVYVSTKRTRKLNKYH